MYIYIYTCIIYVINCLASLAQTEGLDGGEEEAEGHGVQRALHLDSASATRRNNFDSLPTRVRHRAISKGSAWKKAIARSDLPWNAQDDG
jgi:hypothetical protein